jgi:flagellar biosynthetic protein FliP
MSAAPSTPLVTAAQAGVQMALGGSGSSAVKIFLILTALSFGSAIILSLTSFTRIIIVMSFLRQAIGTPQLPPNQVLMGLSLFLTLFIMAPTATRVQKDALGPLLEDKISVSEALDRAEKPMGDWMLKQTHEEDLSLFYDIAGRARPARGEAIAFSALVPAFMVSELNTAFKMGLYVYIPMLLIDLLVGTILMSLGMMMVPPQLIGLPLKIGIFLLAGGWHLVVSSLVKSF